MISVGSEGWGCCERDCLSVPENKETFQIRISYQEYSCISLQCNDVDGCGRQGRGRQCEDGNIYFVTIICGRLLSFG